MVSLISTMFQIGFYKISISFICFASILYIDIKYKKWKIKNINNDIQNYIINNIIPDVENGGLLNNKITLKYSTLNTNDTVSAYYFKIRKYNNYSDFILNNISLEYLENYGLIYSNGIENSNIIEYYDYIIEYYYLRTIIIIKIVEKNPIHNGYTINISSEEIEETEEIEENKEIRVK